MYIFYSDILWYWNDDQLKNEMLKFQNNKLVRSVVIFVCAILCGHIFISLSKYSLPTKNIQVENEGNG